MSTSDLNSFVTVKFVTNITGGGGMLNGNNKVNINLLVLDDHINFSKQC
jgi:hypothetical protein